MGKKGGCVSCSTAASFGGGRTRWSLARGGLELIYLRKSSRKRKSTAFAGDQTSEPVPGGVPPLKKKRKAGHLVSSMERGEVKRGKANRERSPFGTLKGSPGEEKPLGAPRV